MINTKDTMAKDIDKEFLEYIVKELVDNPKDVKVERKVDEMGVLIELNVDPEDMGKIIGKEGKTAKSIRTLLRVLGAKERARVNMKIIEPETGDAVKESAGEIVNVEEPVKEPVEEPKEKKSDDDGDVEMKPIEEKSTDVF